MKPGALLTRSHGILTFTTLLRRRRNQGPEEVGDLPQASYPVKGKVRIQAPPT